MLHSSFISEQIVSLSSEETVSCWQKRATYDVVQVEIQRNDDNSVDLIFSAAPSATQDYLVLVSKFPAAS